MFWLIELVVSEGGLIVESLEDNGLLLLVLLVECEGVREGGFGSGGELSHLV